MLMDVGRARMVDDMRLLLASFQRRALLGLAIFLLAPLPGKAKDAEPDKKKPAPNILFILIDDLGWMDLNCQGSQQFNTPNIDRLATQGMRFTDAYAAAPVCSPTRAAAITGLAPARVKVTNHNPDRWSFYTGKKMGPGKSARFLDAKYETVAEILKRNGYDTAFLGKWHLSQDSRGKLDIPHMPESRGFDINIGGCSMGGPGTFFAPFKIPNMTQGKKGDYLPYTFAREAVKILTKQKKSSKPFFLALWHYTVHYPIQATDELYKKNNPTNSEPTDQQRYRAMVEGMDNAVGTVLGALDDLGLAENTLVIFTSDNGNLSGYSSARPLKGAKGYLSEGGIRVPLIVRFPGRVQAGTISDEPVISMDFTPTFLEAAGIQYDASKYDGQSILSELKQPGSMKRDSIYFHYPHYAFHRDNKMGSAIRSGDFKLIKYYDGHETVLYNLRKDLGEKHDLARKMPEKTAALLKKLNAWLKETGATFPRPLSEIPEEELVGRRKN